MFVNVTLLNDCITSSEVSDDAANSGFSNFSQSDNCSKQWQCPWGSTVVDDVAPEFKLILEENYLSSSTSSLEDTKENRKQWWNWRKKLDHRLSEFLKYGSSLIFMPLCIFLFL